MNYKKVKLLFFITLLSFSISMINNAFGQVKIEESYGSGKNVFTLATGSPGELGLLKELGEAFGKKYNAKLNWIKAGSGESMKMLKEKQADMIMVHAVTAEKNAIKEGWAVKRVLIGSNEFFIVGPADDPAGISKAANAADAYKMISSKKIKFFSRGDNSGTHKKEESIWKAAGITPSGSWYIVTGEFMTATLKKANDQKGYFMTDSSTWVAEWKSVPNLKILFKGDKALINTYHTLVQPDGATPGAKTASAFVDFVSSKEGQQIIRSYGKALYGEALYNDQEYAKKYDE